MVYKGTKRKKDIFASLLTKIFNNAISQNEFPDNLEVGDITPCLKGMTLRINVITDPLPYCPLSLTYLSIFCTLR